MKKIEKAQTENSLHTGSAVSLDEAVRLLSIYYERSLAGQAHETQHTPSSRPSYIATPLN